MMNISELSIRRPVLATVFTLIILIFGAIGYLYLGVREFPSVDNPIISVSCSYPGANADVIENQITEPLEQNINGIPGIRSLTSVSQQGNCRITVEFELSVDLETAANDVRDKVSRAQRYLPRDCDPPTVSKADADARPILMVAIQSDKRSLLELSEIADLTVKEQLQTIPEVSSVQIWGEKRYCMRLWLDPIKMAGYGITPMDVKQALDRENVELPSGSIEGNTVELEHPHYGTDAQYRGIQRPDCEVDRQQYHPTERHRTRRTQSARPEKLHEDEQRAHGRRGSGAAARCQPHQHCRCRA